MAIANILNRLEQVEKENEELEENYNVLEKAYITDNIPKPVIRDKIEELDKQEKEQLKGMKGQDRYSVKQEFMFRRNTLKEILGER